jgi:phage FluMu protein Com
MRAERGAIGPSTKSTDLVVFSIIRDSRCSECGEVLGKGRCLYLEAGQPLCLRCADLDHLVYVPRGNTALTRRARKESALSAVVVRFSRSRRRYERQGILVEEGALQRAEQDCLADQEMRAARREREAGYRAQQDRELAAHMTEAILELFPGCPPDEARRISAHTAARGSGRVGRTAAGRGLEQEALIAAVIAAVRHHHTCYDDLLMKGYGRVEARALVRESIDAVLQRWRSADPTEPTA